MRKHMKTGLYSLSSSRSRSRPWSWNKDCVCSRVS